MFDSYMVAIVDDEELVLLSTKMLLNGIGYSVSTFSTGEEFLSSQNAQTFHCVLLDMRMPGMDGIAVIRELEKRGDGPAIVVLTGHGDIPLAVEAMRLGAFDFIEKPYDPSILLAVVARGVANPPVPLRQPEVDREAQEKVALLSNRQRGVLSGMLRGRPNKIIAYELGLSIRTVESYRAQMLTKLGVRGTAEAVRLAISAGLAEE